MEGRQLLSGYLLATTQVGRPKLTWISTLPGIGNHKTLSPSNWDSFLLQTKEKLIAEEETKAKYEYPLVYARSDDRALVLSSNRDVVYHLLQDSAFNLKQHFGTFQIRLEHLVENSIQSGAEFRLSNVYAWFRRNQGATSVTFNGTDIAREDKFKEMRNQLDVLNCGFRRSTEVSGELMRLGRDGRIRFDVGGIGSNRLEVYQRVQECLLFMRNQRSKDTSGQNTRWLEYPPGHPLRAQENDVMPEVDF